jgi:hypothetical protein
LVYNWFRKSSCPSGALLVLNKCAPNTENKVQGFKTVFCVTPEIPLNNKEGVFLRPLFVVDKPNP